MALRIDDRDPTTPLRNVDWSLVGIVAALVGMGGAMIYSATKGSGLTADTYYLTRVVLWVVVAAPVMLVTALVDYRRLRRFIPVFYGGTILLLVAVLVVGSTRNSAQAWFAFGSFQLQPSEPAKVVLVLTLASYLATHRHRLDVRRLAISLILAGVPMGLILLQPDLGTMLVFVAVTLALLTVAGVRARYLIGLLALGVALSAAVLTSDMLADYQRDRLRVFISDDVSDAAQAEAFNLEQSKIAIGLGGLTGQGYGAGFQTQNDLVPEQQTDFIFTVVGEELGFVGAVAVLGLFAVLTLRVLRAAKLARDDFGSLLCVGVLAMIVFQVFQNVGMTMGIVPITGIPLPFVSYGGSSLLTTCAAMGMVLNVRMHRFR
jgi:rod shape determining protein RodA